jgi:DNA polymerase type B, organellar and viral
MYHEEFGIDITTILSTSTLSLKIFRKKFLDVEIPILSGWIDKFIRSGYFGGATDYYKAIGYNLKYYDVNSLYP